MVAANSVKARAADIKDQSFASVRPVAEASFRERKNYTIFRTQKTASHQCAGFAVIRQGECDCPRSGESHSPCLIGWVH